MRRLGVKGVCPSGKIRYRNEEEAHEEMERMARRTDREEKGLRMPTGSYRCKQCGGHHLTSRVKGAA